LFGKSELSWVYGWYWG